MQEIIVDESTAIYISSKGDYTEYNRFFNGYILIGTFLVVSIKKNNRRVSMKNKAIRKYMNIFKL